MAATHKATGGGRLSLAATHKATGGDAVPDLRQALSR